MARKNPATKKKTKRRQPKLSRLNPPPGMSLENWQIELRRQFGREQKFKLKNLGANPVFSEFQVANPDSKSVYRVAIRGRNPGDNFCSCPDFATNALGTCKHIEFALEKLRRQTGGKAAFARGYQPDFSEVYLRYGARREVRLRLAAGSPPDVVQLANQYFDNDGLLQPDAFARFERFLADSASLDHDLQCKEDVLGYIAELRDRDHRRLKLAEAFPKGIESAAFNKLLTIPLYDYQRQGALFAATAGRCLIGDEMGLGKTAQAMAAVEIMARHFGVERVLVVCPTSLKHQWEREISRFTGRASQVISGLRNRRAETFAADSFYKITNYDTVHSDLDLIRGWSPDLVILDEAQRIKNWSTRAAKSVKQISSPYAIVLTGTPLENRLEELVSIVQFVDQHRLGPTFRFLADHQIRDGETGRVIGYKDLDSIGKTLEPILIRRRKKQVLQQLPGRIDKNFFVPMTPEQMTHHDENREIVARIVLKWRRLHFLSETDQRRLMICLQNMRMSCDSTYLLDHKTDFGVKADELATLLGEMLEEPGAKVVIFSQWLRMHELLQRRLRKQQWGHVTFHGGVPGSQRKKLVDRFREEEHTRAFLSTDAGGVGLNLQHANVVINMDLPWNPAVLEQRIGRVHRLGQRQPVQVVNFISRGTIEEGMLETLKFKTSLFSGALDGGDKEIFLGGSRLNRFMETVEKATAASIEPVVQDAPDSATSEQSRIEPAISSDTEAVDVEEAPTAPGVSPAAPSSAPAGGDNFWNGLLQTGLTLLEQLAASAKSPSPPTAERPASAPATLVRRDESSGENYLRLPMPSPEVLDRALGALSALLGKFK